jgi:hypothetical protein
MVSAQVRKKTIFKFPASQWELGREVPKANISLQIFCPQGSITDV